MRKYLPHILIISFIFLSPPIMQAVAKERVNLRSYYDKLSESEVKSLSHIVIRKKTNFGFCVYSTIDHDYEVKMINGDKVVIDHSTGLMWHQLGSKDYMPWQEAPYEIEEFLGIDSNKYTHQKEWVTDLNNRGYAGHYDWRLPTVEELISLLEPSKKNGDLYIDSVFDKKQNNIWTGDRWTGARDSVFAWHVHFNSGEICLENVTLYDALYIRPVRSMK